MAGEASVRQRAQNAGYLKVGETFEFMGTGFTQLDDSPAAATKQKRYINMVSESQSISGYAWTAPFTFDQIDSEKAIAHLIKVGKEELVGGDAETEYIDVDLLGEKDATAEASKGYPARKRRVAIEISSFDDSDGEIEGSGNLLAKSDWEYGWFDTTGKTFTADNSAKSNFAYAKTLSAQTV
jgi:hypothetical protein